MSRVHAFKWRMIAGILSVLGALLPGAGAQAGVMHIWQPKPATGQILGATFWARPYPYGYAYVFAPEHNYRNVRNEQCIQRRKIKTAHGWRVKRVWVCHNKIVRK